MSSLLPTPAKSHYTFNLRDLAKVFQGTLMGSPKFIEKPIGMVRLWSHELKRVFEDRLTTSDDHDWFVGQLTECVSSKFGMKWSDIVRTERADSASSSTLNLSASRRWRLRASSSPPRHRCDAFLASRRVRAVASRDLGTAAMFSAQTRPRPPRHI